MLKWLEIIVRTIVSTLCTQRSLAIENLVLRQQLAVLKHRHPRPRLTDTDRFFWVVLSRIWVDWRDCAGFLHSSNFYLPDSLCPAHSEPRSAADTALKCDGTSECGLDCAATTGSIGSIRRECLDHMIILNERHLKRILSSYVAYYHGARTHLSLAKDTPDGREVQAIENGSVVELKQVGGLHHLYTRVAA